MLFRRAQRLAHDLEYQAVHRARVRKSRGPLVVAGAPNGLPHPRLGLAVGRRAGGAVQRSRIKRLIREAFRLEEPALPRGLDLVVGVRDGGARGPKRPRHRGSPAPATPAPEPLRLDTCRRLLVELAGEVAAEWARRDRRERARAQGPAPGAAG